MEQSASTEQVTPIDPREELRQLEIESNTTKNWTPEKARRLLTLREQAANKPILTEAHKKALQRQGTAGFGGQPELTPEERRLIQEANEASKKS